MKTFNEKVSEWFLNNFNTSFKHAIYKYDWAPTAFIRDNIVIEYMIAARQLLTLTLWVRKGDRWHKHELDRKDSDVHAAFYNVYNHDVKDKELKNQNTILKGLGIV